MTLATFRIAPWRRENTHAKYRESSFSMSPAPEYASSEVLLASLYRTIGFSSVSEGAVPKNGRELDRKIQRLREKHSPAPIDAILSVDTWNTVLHGVLESPKLPNQSSKRFLQVTPLVPQTALFSGSARLSSNSWPAGSLVRRMVWLGSKDSDFAHTLWKDLFSALSVGADDDVFARWLEREASTWSENPPSWEMAPIPEQDVATLIEDDLANISFLPARQFTRDLRAIIQAKNSMTRRQWTSLLESVLRMAAVSHVTWLCDVQARIWGAISAALAKGEGPLDAEEARLTIFPNNPKYMAYGAKALNGLKDKASGYLSSRLGTNTVLWALEEIGVPFEGNLSSSEGVASLCQLIRAKRIDLTSLETREIVSELREREARALLCKKGIGANLLEFARHALGQRQTAVHLLRGYDQGYVLKKKGNSTSSPWVVSLGPVAVLAIVHCALSGMGGPRSVRRLAQHLAEYGVIVDLHDIARNDLGYQLRMLGLVLDSPDAESGMLLLPPFTTTAAVRANEI